MQYVISTWQMNFLMVQIFLKLAYIEDTSEKKNVYLKDSQEF